MKKKEFTFKQLTETINELYPSKNKDEQDCYRTIHLEFNKNGIVNIDELYTTISTYIEKALEGDRQKAETLLNDYEGGIDISRHTTIERAQSGVYLNFIGITRRIIHLKNKK